MNAGLGELPMPLHVRSEQPITDEELLRFSAENELLRIERDATGELIIMSPSGTESGGLELDIAAELRAWALSHGRGRAYGSNAGFKLPDSSVRAADAHWVVGKRLGALTTDEKRGYAPLCPEVIIELRSESDRLPALQNKMRMWLSNGAELAWLIDPSRKVVEIYRPGQDTEVQEGTSAACGEGPVAGFVLELGQVWR